MTTSLRAIVETHDWDALSDRMVEDVELRSPVVAEPMRGREPVVLQFGKALAGFDDFAYTHELAGEGSLALVFTAAFNGAPVEGVDVFMFDDAGRITDVIVMLRPYPVLEAIAAARRAATASG